LISPLMFFCAGWCDVLVVMGELFICNHE
jgi:hypothetical protein